MSEGPLSRNSRQEEDGAEMSVGPSFSQLLVAEMSVGPAVLFDGWSEQLDRGLWDSAAEDVVHPRRRNGSDSVRYAAKYRCVDAYPPRFRVQAKAFQVVSVGGHGVRPQMGPSDRDRAKMRSMTLTRRGCQDILF